MAVLIFIHDSESERLLIRAVHGDVEEAVNNIADEEQFSMGNVSFGGVSKISIETKEHKLEI